MIINKHIKKKYKKKYKKKGFKVSLAFWLKKLLLTPPSRIRHFCLVRIGPCFINKYFFNCFDWLSDYYGTCQVLFLRSKEKVLSLARNALTVRRLVPSLVCC